MQANVRTPIVALLGNPNTGKTTLFNALCGARRKTANYPGVTIEHTIGRCHLESGPIHIVDLPGTYSLKADSPDEEVVADSLMGRAGHARPDAVIIVLDAANLERNLYLFTQALEAGLPALVALTMTDRLAGEGITLNVSLLETKLGVPVVAVPAGDRQALAGLRQRLADTLAKGRRPAPVIQYPPQLEKQTAALATMLSSETAAYAPFEARQLILHANHPLSERFASSTQLRTAIESARRATAQAGQAAPAPFAFARYEWIRRVVAAVQEKQTGRGPSLTERVDRVLLHRGLGLGFFVGLMYVVFTSIYTWAEPLMNAIEAGLRLLAATSSPWFGDAVMLQSLVADGVIGGVGSVLVFLPQIVILFLFIAVLEDSGYLARAAFLMDRLLGWTGLNGRAFIPMLSSFACAVPGVMSARVMSDPRARLTTILVAPLMSCSARLPVYVLLIGSFIEPIYGAAIAGLTLFLMHGVGAFTALPIALILNRGFLKTPTIPFVLELPPYRRPNLRSVLFRVWDAAKKFLVRSGSVIFAMSVIIWALTYFPRSTERAQKITAEYSRSITLAKQRGQKKQLRQLTQRRDQKIAAAQLERSYLGRAGHFVQPVFAPLGYDWKITVGILGAFPAREVIIATLGIIYSVGDADEKSPTLRSKLQKETWPDGRKVFTPLTALSIMIFFALCCQCMSTVITVARELRSKSWALFLFVYMTVLAYVVSLAVYQGGRWLGFP